ncbi:MAG: sulfotransferase, partial [Desulfatirhabdiaceae bacterium]
KRGLFFSVFFTGYFLAMVINIICFRLDRIFYLKKRVVSLDPPVFIIGNPRSGTTYLHRLMSQDKKRFFDFHTWEIVFPSLVQKKVLSFLAKIDKAFGHPVYRIIQSSEKNALIDYKKIHPTGLFVPEECELLLVHIFATFYLLFLLPFDDVFEQYMKFDRMLASHEKLKILTFYRECIHRQAVFRKTGTRLLSKSPAFSCKIDSLRQFFPGCKFIYLVRSPMEVVPSVLSMIAEIYRSSLELPLDADIIRRTYDLTKSFYFEAIDQLENADPSSYVIVNYEHLVKCPLDVISSIYQTFGFSLDPEYEHFLLEENEKIRHYRSGHTYSLNQFNLSSGQIHHDFKDIFDRFGFR